MSFVFPKKAPRDVRIDALEEASSEARRFLVKCERALEEVRNQSYSGYPTVHFSAAKRSSMDLTRALAKVRRNPNSMGQG